MVLALFLLACDVPPVGCDAMPERDPPRTEAAVAALLDDARTALYPELVDVDIELRATQSDSDFFVANLDVTTLEDPPLQRLYLVQYSELLFDDPPSGAATGAILGHELKHVLDYTAMDASALAEFALWYLQGDIAAYERETDEYVLQRGCGPGLSAYRTWLYAHVDAETAAQKRIDYYTPEEIAAWMQANDS